MRSKNVKKVKIKYVYTIHTGNIGNDGVLGQISGNNQFRSDLEKSIKKFYYQMSE